jgi:hypothetical protein
MRVLGLVVLLAASVAAQPPNVSQVVLWSTLTNNQSVKPVTAFNGQSNPTFTPQNAAGLPVTGNLPLSLLSVYTDKDSGGGINTVTNYNVANPSALASALSTNIAVALSVIPLESPTSGVILRMDPATGAVLPVSNTLGPIFTQRAETIGKGKFYVGFTHQNYHFTSLDGRSLNGLSVLYGGRDPSGQSSTGTSQATFNLGLDVRLSQDLVFLTYGVTNSFDVSVGLPSVHAAVASRAYNGLIYSGTGTGLGNGDICWCVSTFSPGSYSLAAPQIGQASLSKTGFGDVVLRFKDAMLVRSNMTLAAGADLRLPSGDAKNYLGIGTTAVKPFAVLSLFKPVAKNIVLAPHFDIGWQFAGSSVLGGSLSGSPGSATLSNGVSAPYVAAPFTSTKGTLPDIFSWGLGTEVALGRHNTLILDVVGNQIGWINGAATLKSQPVAGLAPSGPQNAGVQAQTSGLVATAAKSSFGEYNGAFGYKVRIVGNLVATFQALVRFDDNGLTARFTPLYGLGYSF